MGNIFNKVNESTISALRTLEVEVKCWSWAEMHPNRSLGLVQAPGVPSSPRALRFSHTLHAGALRVPALRAQRSEHRSMLQSSGLSGVRGPRTKTIWPQWVQGELATPTLTPTCRSASVPAAGGSPGCLRWRGLPLGDLKEPWVTLRGRDLGTLVLEPPEG